LHAPAVATDHGLNFPAYRVVCNLTRNDFYMIAG
jgi:hypothetical protein